MTHLDRFRNTEVSLLDIDKYSQIYRDIHLYILKLTFTTNLIWITIIFQNNMKFSLNRNSF